MTDITIYPAANADDGVIINDTSFLNNNSSYLQVGKSGGSNFNTFIRFPGVNIPAGSEITAAYLTFTSVYDTADDPARVNIKYVDENNPSSPTDLSSWNALSWSSNAVSWLIDDTFIDTAFNSPSILNLVQEIVLRSGWVSGNAMLFALFNDSSSYARFIYPYDAGSNFAELHITYTADSLVFLDTITSADTISHNIPIIEESINNTDVINTNTIQGLILNDSNNLADVITSSFTYDKSLSDSFTANDSVSNFLTIVLSMMDSLDGSETINGYHPIYESILDSLFIWDNQTSQWQLNISDSFDGVDNLTIYLVILLSDYIAASDTILSNCNSNLSLSDTLKARDELLTTLTLTLTDALNAADSFTPILTLMIVDYLTLRDIVVSSGSFNHEIADTIVATDSMVSQWMLSLLDSFAGTDAINQCKFISESILDELTISDALSSTGVFNLTVEETLQIIDLIQNHYGLNISDSLNAADSFTNIATLYDTLSDSLNAADALTATLTAYLTITDGLVVVDIINSNGIFYETISDTIQLNVLIEIDSEIYECFVLNTPQFFPSVYSGFNYNSYTVFNNRIFAANSTGIFELTGTDDNGSVIHTGVQLQETDFGTIAKKRIRKGFLGISGTTPVISMEATDTEIKRTYSISDNGEVSAVRDVVGRKWKLSVMDFDELDSIELVPIVLTKRRK